MISSGLWRNRNCMDVDFDIIKITYRGLKYIKARVRYVCRRTGGIYGVQTVKIQLKDLANWEKIGA